MAVPAHDSRDYAFAKHFNLPIIPLIEGCDVSEESLDAKEGIMIIGIDGENGAIRAVAKGDLTATFTYSTVAPEGVIAAHALATKNLDELNKLGKMTKKSDGSMEIEIASNMITKENAAQFFCKGFGDDPECK